MKKLVIFFVTIAIGIMLPFCIFSQEAEDIILYVGESKIVSGYGIQRIAISRPEVVDVVEVTENEITLAGKLKGESTLVWWDKTGKYTLRVKVYSGDMTGIKERVDRLLKEINVPGVYSKAIDSEGKVFLFGQITKESEMEKITSALVELRGKVVNLIQLKESNSIVEISVQILELKKGKDEHWGFSLPSSITLSETTAPTSMLFNGLFPFLCGIGQVFLRL